jgi:hypothetical protein
MSAFRMNTYLKLIPTYRKMKLLFFRVIFLHKIMSTHQQQR